MATIEGWPPSPSPMRIVPIPPTSLIEHCAELYPFQFCLTHVYRNNPEYRKAYDKIGKSDKHHLILDNGAFENGSADKLKDIMDVIDHVNPTEVVLPDRMFMADTTYEMSARAKETLTKYYDGIKFMAVVHGRTVDEWLKSMYQMLSLQPDCIAIPKDYEAFPGGRELLLHFIPEGIPVHLIGQERDIYAIYKLAEPVRHKVRSIDTAKPFVYALADIKLDKTGGIPPYPGRPSDYFEIPAEDTHPNWNLHKHNLDMFAHAARDHEALK